MLSLSSVYAVLLVALSAPPAVAGQNVPAECSDDRGVNRCSIEQHRRVLESYGMKPIEVHAAAGDQVRRIFYVDGYGKDLLAISFIRSAGRDPMLTIRVPRSEGAAAEVGETLVPEQVWDQVIAGSEHFDRALAPRAGREMPPICMHSWVYTIEAADVVENGSQRPAVRRETEDACEGGLGQVFASQVAELAVPFFPYCAALDRSQQRNSATLLNTCAALRGDRLAAAKAHNQLLKLNQLSNPLLTEASLNIFQYRASLDWNGEQIGGDQQAAARRGGSGKTRHPAHTFGSRAGPANASIGCGQRAS